jgi:glycosyltransferase involved in cell wall biosynthesis
MLSSAFNLTIICPCGTQVPSSIASACSVIYIPCGYVGGRWNIINVTRFIFQAMKWLKVAYANADQKKMPPPIATGFDFPCLFLGQWAKKRFSIKWVVFCWDPPVLHLRHAETPLNKLIIKYVNRLFCRLVQRGDQLVINLKRGFFDTIGLKMESPKIVESINGVALEHLQVNVTQKEPWLIGVLSHATTEKGIWTVLDAFCELAPKFEKLKILWVGEVPQSVQRKIEFRLQSEGILASRFSLIGKRPQTEAFNLLSSCGVLLYPYCPTKGYWFNYPLKILEYMYLGGTIVATNTEGVKAYIRNAENGLLFDGSVKGLIDNLKMIVGNEVLQKKFATTALSEVEKYNWKKVNDDILKQLVC